MKDQKRFIMFAIDLIIGSFLKANFSHLIFFFITNYFIQINENYAHHQISSRVEFYRYFCLQNYYHAYRVKCHVLSQSAVSLVQTYV